jgi:hypothetical protein
MQNPAGVHMHIHCNGILQPSLFMQSGVLGGVHIACLVPALFPTDVTHRASRWRRRR